jgi:hypothetical protein
MPDKRGKFTAGELAGTLAREAGRAIARSVGAGSGLSQKAGRALSSRKRRIDAATSWGDNAKGDVRRK